MSSSASNPIFPRSEILARARRTIDGGAALARTPDEGLMALVRDGHQEALGILLDRYAALVISIGSRVLRDSGEAQELVQDVFLQVYRKGHVFDPAKGSFRSWLFQIASHKALDRREYLNLHRFYDARNLEDFMDVMQSSCNLEYQAQVRQSEATLRKTFQNLSEKQRTTLELYFFEGYTLREISDFLNESLSNVRHYYYRAIERLRGCIQNNSSEDD